MPAVEPAPVHLTFDDGPEPEGTPAVLEALAAAGARATFFVMTTKVARHPELLHAIRAAGHGVGLHCHEHRRHTTLSAEAIARDTDTALAILAEHGVAPTLWRLPWGVAAEATPSIAWARGLQLVHWSADTEDWRGGDAEGMLARVLPDLVPGGIVLAHDGIGPGATRTRCDQTVALIAPLVRTLRDRGWACRPVPEAVAA
jgi:peptidoglycan/xylan/chitin deacetylase (PgdA/CDA1 family)